MAALAPITVQELTEALEDVNLIRYTSAVGMMLMFYDHVLTFSDEVELVWKAPPSFSRTLFLLNRYAVVVTHTCIAIIINHFGTDSLSKTTCQWTIAMTCIFGQTSTACANVLVILRVNVLWDRNIRVGILLGLTFCATFFTSMGFMINILVKSFNNFEYVPLLHSCGSLIDPSRLPGVWISAFVFEVLVLSFVIINAMSRPRSIDTPLRRVLCLDGILFFATLASLQLLNVVLSLAARDVLNALGVFFVWALVTLVLNRSLLDMQKASLRCQHSFLPLTGLEPYPRNCTFSRITRRRDMHGQGHHRGNLYGGSISKVFSDPESGPNAKSPCVHCSNSADAGANPVPGRPGVQILCVGAKCGVFEGNPNTHPEALPSASLRSSYASGHFREPSITDPIPEE